MGFESTFNVEPKGNETTIKIDKGAFMKEGVLATNAKNILDLAQITLNSGQAMMKKTLKGGDEMSVANLAIEKMLNDSIPTKFEREYREAGNDWEQATFLITMNILATLNDHISNKLPQVIKAVDKASSYIGTDMDKKQATKAYTRLGFGPEEIQGFLERYKPPTTAVAAAPKKDWREGLGYGLSGRGRNEADRVIGH